MKRAILQVSGMTCPSCLDTIRTAVARQHGVQDVEVLFNAGKVKANFDERATNARSLANTVEKMGYVVERTTTKEN
ncbi:MAG: heavy-metal-associated domain-containing protein [Bifidobacterium aquikefiri]|uniref:Copper chaperone CopZ n=2 Tax=Bifidobacterium TaxID=1678 RepID=A0A261GBG8_9BIFI|nr:heavy-metal-associated domain-containing protein [Bifidobacterium aquikefiri]OZG68777.1 heavy metal-binding protein [Bifidobacterium aquikefiri]